MNQLRAFIAVPLALETARRICRIQQTLAEKLPEFRPVAWQNLHLTLIFLGEQSPQMLEETAELMLSIAAETEPFNAPFEGWKLAGRGNRRRPLCLEISPLPQLLVLQQRLSQRLATLGIEFEQRRYWPHLALGRMPPLPDNEKLEPLRAEIPALLRVERLCLYSSRLLARGAEHRLLSTGECQGQKTL